MLRFRQELQDMTEAEFANHIQAVESMKLEKDKVRVVCALVMREGRTWMWGVGERASVLCAFHRVLGDWIPTPRTIPP